MIVPNFKVVFSLQNLLKVLNSAVILRYHSLESVHGAWRTRRMKFENWQSMDLLPTFPSLTFLSKKGKLAINPCTVNIQTSFFSFFELREPILTNGSSKWPRWEVLLEKQNEKTFFQNLTLVFSKKLIFIEQKLKN